MSHPLFWAPVNALKAEVLLTHTTSEIRRELARLGVTMRHIREGLGWSRVTRDVLAGALAQERVRLFRVEHGRWPTAEEVSA